VNDLDLVPIHLLIDRIPGLARPYARVTVLPVALPVMAAGLAVALSQIAMFETLFSADPSPDPDAMAAALVTLGSFFALAMAMMAIYALAFGALTVAAVDALAGRPVSMGRAWTSILRPRVLLTLLLVGMASAGSLMMCILPALYVIPLLSFVLPAMIDEDLGVGEAFRRSIELMHWNPTQRLGQTPWLQAFLILFIGFVVNYAANLLVQMPFLIAQQMLILRESFSGEIVNPAEMTQALWLQVPAVLLGSVATALTWLYSAFGTVLLFREVRRRKEAADLEEAVSELTGVAL
jgi:uncharacterized membrane protein